MKKDKLYYNTITPLLYEVLKTLMGASVFDSFRLVGGTALSLQCGHRKSVDIDLFTAATYGSIDFDAIDEFINAQYSYVDSGNSKIVGMGRSCFMGNSRDESIKLDMFYTDEYIQPPLIVDGIRLATIEEIIAMKVDVIGRGGRKKDFWDLHELMSKYSFAQMLALHERRYPYTHNEEEIRNNFTDFSKADEDFEPVCLRGKTWELVKLDMLDFVKS